MRWLVDGYNVIRRSPAWGALERHGLDEARAALCRALGDAALRSGDRFIVVFDGAGAGGAGLGPAGVRVVFSSARESADRVLARLARDGGAVVSSDREVREEARRAGALSVTAEEFLARLERARSDRGTPDGDAPPEAKDEVSDDAPRPPRKGNPRRLSKKDRVRARALRRL